MDWPTVAINIVTYNRRDILAITLARLLAFIQYEGALQVVVADDGSDDGTHELVRGFTGSATPVELVITRRGGMGANANAGLRRAFALTDYVLQLQDDMQLQGPLDLHPHVQRLTEDETCGYIRLWGVAGHHYEARLEGSYWRVMWHSDELYIPSDRPHIKHRRFHDTYGLYPEGLATAATEEAWCHQCKDRAGTNGKQLDVFVPHSLPIETMWEHAGWHQRWRDQGL